jgi:hypothetical protein
MKRQGEEYVQNQLDRFLAAIEALEADDANYANHEEKRESLLKYYKERVTSYETQLRKINSQRTSSATIKRSESAV